MVDAETAQKAGWWFLRSLGKMFYIVPPSEYALDEGDHAPNVIVENGVPMFFVLIAIEHIGYLLSRGPKKARKLADWNFAETAMSIFSGSFQQMFLLFTELMGVSISVMAYRYVYDNYRLQTIETKAHPVACFIAIMLLKDLGYYWMHRCLHTFHVMWTAHSVHHSGEFYNLPTALRQGALQPFFGFPFYLPIALLGFSPTAFAVHSGTNTMYQFWVHTDLVGRMPFGLEYVINTPMAHRLHHRPPGNCNYAGVFIIWDRMFGTYRGETVRKDLYGLAKQPDTFDPAQLNVRHFSIMADIGNASTTWLRRCCATRARHKCRFEPWKLFEPIPAQVEDRRADGPMRKKWEGARPMTGFARLFVTLASFCGLLATVACLHLHKQMHILDASAAVFVTSAVISSIGIVCDQREGQAERAMCSTTLLLPALFAIIQYNPFSGLAGNSIPSFNTSAPEL